MATLRELIVKISANSQSFQSEIQRASRMGADYYKTMENGGKRAAAATRESERALAQLNGQFSSIKASASGMAAMFVGAFATTELIRFADTWTMLNSRLKLASGSAEQFNANQKALMDISQRTGTSLEANTNMFSRMSQAMKQLGYSGADTAKVTELVATSLRLSGAGAGEAASVITQFGQAMASGVLRGDEFNSIMENGGRFAQALADGLGVTIGQLRAMAQAGQLTSDKIMPALLSQLGKVEKEGEAMGATVSASMQRVENAFLAWVGTSNDAVGASSALAGALDWAAKNINGLATAGGLLASIGIARTINSWSKSLSSAAGEIIKTRLAEVEVNAAQLEGAKVSVARARAAVFRAQQARAAAVGIGEQIVAERALRAAQGDLTNAMGARAGAAARLTESAGLMSRLGGSVLGVLGGWPGLIMAAGGAMYALHERTVEAHKDALGFSDSITDLNAKLKETSSIQLMANAAKGRESLGAMQEDLNKLDGQIRDVQGSLKGIDAMKAVSDAANPDSLNLNNLTTYNGLIRDQKEAEDKLYQLQAEREALASKFTATQNYVNDASKVAEEKAIAEASAVNALTGAYAMLNKTMGVNGNAKENFNFQKNPLIVSNAQNLTPQQQKALEESRRAKEMAGMNETQRSRATAEYSAKDLGLEGAAYSKYVQNMVEADATKRAVTASTKEHNKALREGAKEASAATKVDEDYKQKMKDISLEIDIQNVRLKDGQKAADLYAASHKDGKKWTDEQTKAYQAQSTKLEELTQKADEAIRISKLQEQAVKDLNEATKQFKQTTEGQKATRGASAQQKAYQDELNQLDRVYEKTDKSQKAQEAYNNSVKALKSKYDESAAAAADWSAGIASAYKDWIDSSSNYAQQAGDATKSALDGIVNNLTDALNNNKASWKDWGTSVLQSIEKILVNAALVQGLQALGGAMGSGSGVMGSIGSFLSGIGSAKGNVFAGGISGYSNSIVTRPTMFAFAKGAGLMGEAGPEAVMPLARTSNGRLGVATTGGAGGVVINSTVNVNGNSTSSQTSGSNDAIGRAYQKTIDQSISDGIRRELKPGGMIWQASQKR